MLLMCGAAKMSKRFIVECDLIVVIGYMQEYFEYISVLSI